MKKYSLSVFLLLLGLALLVSACSGSGASEGAAAAAVTPTPTEEKTVAVEVGEVTTGDIDLVFSYSGSVQPKDDVDLTPGATGKVEQLLVEVGDQVKAGDKIAIIDDGTYLAQLKQAEAELASASLQLAKIEQGSRPEEIIAARAAVELARAALNDVATVDDNERTKAAAELARTEAALKAAQAEYDKIAWAGDVGDKPQAVALQQATINYENALADYNLDTNPSDSQLAPLMLNLAQAELQLSLTLEPYREVDVALARVGVQRAQAALDIAKIQLEETVIEAPFDGVIAELYISQGSRVTPQNNVVELLSDALEIKVEVQESRISQVTKGQAVSMRTTAYPGQDFPGVVTNISPKANADTRTFEVTVTPTEGAELLRSGMFADVAILAQENSNTVLAPRNAVIQDTDPPTVFVVGDDNRAEERKVNTGLFDNDRIEILSGLKPGEIVVTAGQGSLTSGTKLDVTNDPRVAE
ncbi:MAG: efflux RND transporter periplasmic adaptor subunit [Anaerolineaceae bacterium]|nr:efflux RND transporter periplasmic adaptor subunit [Anaerolineaceae bacterium]MCB9101196.1 efflux RND transporter periplasmic adaptor subunit [Anaerolineales bacterium]